MNKMRPELSKKNPYWISKYRYYELRYFCLQYYEWKHDYCELELKLSPRTTQYNNVSRTHTNDWVSEAAVKMAELKRKMELVEQTCIETDSDLYSYILQGVTKGYGYTYLQTVLGIPCTKDAYYDKYHKFFYILSNR